MIFLKKSKEASSIHTGATRIKKCSVTTNTHSEPWKIPCEVDSSIVGGLAGTVEVERVSHQHSDRIWADLHLFKNKSCKPEVDNK